MPRVFTTDDSIYRVRLVYLGPPGYTLPIHLPYAAYGLGAIVVSSFLTAGWMAGLGGYWGFTLAVAVFATGLIWRQVDPDRPARMIVRTVLSDWRTFTYPAEKRLPSLSARRLRWADPLPTRYPQRRSVLALEGRRQHG